MRIRYLCDSPNRRNKSWGVRRARKLNRGASENATALRQFKIFEGREIPSQSVRNGERNAYGKESVKVSLSPSYFGDGDIREDGLLGQDFDMAIHVDFH